MQRDKFKPDLHDSNFFFLMLKPDLHEMNREGHNIFYFTKRRK